MLLALVLATAVLWPTTVALSIRAERRRARQRHPSMFVAPSAVGRPVGEADQQTRLVALDGMQMNPPMAS